MQNKGDVMQTQPYTLKNNAAVWIKVSAEVLNNLNLPAESMAVLSPKEVTPVLVLVTLPKAAMGKFRVGVQRGLKAAPALTL